MIKFILICFTLLPFPIFASTHSKFYNPDILAGISLRYLTTEHEVVFLIRLIIAVVLGSLIGLSHSKQKNFIARVSLRTFAAVTLGACTFSSIGCHLFLISGELGNALQIVGPIVSGIGFLCAAVIFKEGVSVHGLSTAASIWTSATIGTACGVGLYGVAITTSILMIILHRMKGTDATVDQT